MAFFPFPMVPMEPLHTMQNISRFAERNVQSHMPMGMPMMSHNQGQSGYYWQQPYSCRRQSAATSGLDDDDDNIHIELDVHDFAPEEISVKVVNNQVVIEGDHEARARGSRGVTAARHFVQRYTLPEDVKCEDITSSLSSDGILIISALKSRNEADVHVIPITSTGMPAKKPANSETSSSKSNSVKK